MIYQVRDIPVYYEEYGKGKPVLCIHGRSVDHNLMTGCLEPIFIQMQNYRRIYLDLPGMGKTPSAKWIHNSDNMLEILNEFIDGVIVNENFIVAGESYGGRLTLGLIDNMKKRIDGVLLICPAIPGNGSIPKRQILMETEALKIHENDPDIKTFMEIAVIASPETFERFKNDVFPGLKVSDNNFLSNYFNGKYNLDLENKLINKTIKFDKPVCILCGRQDHWVGYSNAYELLDNFPRATFAILDCSGHALQIENELVFNQLVKDWIWRIELNEQ